MLTIYSNDHYLYHGRHELIGGQSTPYFKKPSRTDMVLDHVKAADLSETRAPRDSGPGPARRVHNEGFVRLSQDVWQDWPATGRSCGILPIA